MCVSVRVLVSVYIYVHVCVCLCVYLCVYVCVCVHFSPPKIKCTGVYTCMWNVVPTRGEHCLTSF